MLTYLKHVMLCVFFVCKYAVQPSLRTFIFRNKQTRDQTNFPLSITTCADKNNYLLKNNEYGKKLKSKIKGKTRSIQGIASKAVFELSIYQLGQT